MANIVGVKISYCFDGEDTYEHQICVDSLEKAIDYLQKEIIFQKNKNLQHIREELFDIEEELFNNGLSDVRKFSLLRRRDELHRQFITEIAP